MILRFNIISKLLLILILAVSACKKNPEELPLEEENDPEYIRTANVYVAGTTYDIKGARQAAYWKNEVPVVLTNGIMESGANAIDVDGNDIHVVGYTKIENGNFVAVYWKNGMQENLTDGQVSASAVSILVKGKDVYITGFVGANAVYWKNGEKIVLPRSEGMFIASTGGIAINGADIYISGYQVDSYGPSAVYWKNGIPKILPSTKGIYGGGVTTYNEELYVLASYTTPSFSKTDINYWRNEQGISINDGVTGIIPVDILVNNKAIYLACITSKGAGYFKNDKLSTFDTPDSDASGIAIINDDVYISGQATHEKKSVPIFWKNGVPVYLSSPIGKSGRACDIVVKPL